jgi:hypothetical protein
MHILIIAGLVAVALLAIGGGLVLARGGRSTATRAGATTTPPAPTATPERTTSTGSTLNASLEPTVSGMQIATSQQEISHVEGTPLPASNEQFRELTMQLQSLYSDITDLERRLILLTQIADHIERKKNERALTEDEQH